MTDTQRHTSGLHHDNAVPHDPNAIGQAGHGSSRRQFFAQVTRIGTQLTAGLSLLQSASGRGESAPVAVPTGPPTGAIAGGDGVGGSQNLAQPIGIVGVITTYVYGAKGEPLRQLTASGELVAIPDIAGMIADSGGNASTLKATATAHHLTAIDINGKLVEHRNPA